MELTKWKNYQELKCDEFKKQPGVWILRGIPKDVLEPDKYVCLQVCQTKDLKNEMQKDIKYLDRSEPKSLIKDYKNYLGEKIFRYADYPRS